MTLSPGMGLGNGSIVSMGLGGRRKAPPAPVSGGGGGGVYYQPYLEEEGVDIETMSGVVVVPQPEIEVFDLGSFLSKQRLKEMEDREVAIQSQLKDLRDAQGAMTAFGKIMQRELYTLQSQIAEARKELTAVRAEVKQAQEQMIQSRQAVAGDTALDQNTVTMLVGIGLAVVIMVGIGIVGLALLSRQN